MDIDPQTVKNTAPGLLGAIGSILFFRDHPWFMRIGLVFPGWALSHYAYEDVARLTGMSAGTAGFATGILGMVFLFKIVQTWRDLDIGGMFSKLLKKRLGVSDD